MHGEFSGVDDEIAAGGEWDAVGVGFLWSVVENNSDICYSLITQNVAYFVMIKDNNCVRAESVCNFVALC